jgi:hypothetical protein
VEGLVVGHIEESKGWTFWIPATKKLVSSAWADFGRNSLPQPSQTKEANAMVLGNFKQEKAVAKQESNIDNLATLPMPTNPDTPTTFRAAMKSKEAVQWKQAMDVKLDNLRQKAVWRVLPLPKSKKALGA